ncbi:MAG: hypothetical protein ABJN96_08255 [Marinomonas sp.]
MIKALNKTPFKRTRRGTRLIKKVIDIPWRAVKPHLEDAMTKARILWPNALNDLPMNEEHKQHLRAHWQMLHEDFRV